MGMGVLEGPSQEPWQEGGEASVVFPLPPVEWVNLEEGVASAPLRLIGSLIFTLILMLLCAFPMYYIIKDMVTFRGNV